MPHALTIDDHTGRAVARFEQAYGHPPRHAAVAPGRVNLIGEHTDYNDGYVLPMAIERQAIILASPRDDDTVRVRSTNVAGEASFQLTPGITPGEPAWGNYVRGVVAGYLQKGIDPGTGFDALVDSTVPTGGGLSSSAALEVSTATLIETMAGKELDGVEKALLCQRSDHDFVGVPAGIMDQFISVFGQAGHALLIDCRTHEHRPVPLDDPDIVVLIANTNVEHELATGEYGKRSDQCQAAARSLGVDSLRDATLDQLQDAFEDEDELAYRRARHVITENQRTLAAVEAMTQRDWRALGPLMFASHVSLRDDYEVSCRELDLLVDLACEHVHGGDVIGSRMTGGGFGGCTVSLVRAHAADRVADDLHHRYQAATGIEPTVFVTQPAAGARPLRL
ncbi:MAG: galactokinase [Phycisphaeraceae bacterium]